MLIPELEADVRGGIWSGALLRGNYGSQLSASLGRDTRGWMEDGWKACMRLWVGACWLVLLYFVTSGLETIRQGEGLSLSCAPRKSLGFPCLLPWGWAVGRAGLLLGGRDRAGHGWVPICASPSVSGWRRPWLGCF